MQTKIVSCVICALIFATFFIVESTLMVRAITIIVPDNYLTIQKAIDIANPGDTVYVRSGTYYEHLTIDKALTLQGEDKDTTIISGGGSGTVVLSTADWVNVIDLKIIDSGSNFISPHYDSGIALYFSNHSHIENCNTLNNLFGIYLRHSSNTTIINNNASSNSYMGIYLSTSSSDNVISNNVANSNGYSGINIYMDSNNNVISDNIANSNDALGIRIGYSISNTIINNTANSNDYGIYLDQNSKTLVYHNKIINNVHQAWDEDGVNYWDNGYPMGGNYWSDYTGVDNYHGFNQDIPGGDGIGDIPYTNIDGGTPAKDNYPLMNPEIPSFQVTVDIDPDTLNLKSKGRWITCYITLNDPYDVADIDISTILLEDTIPAEWGDIQGDTLMVKFDRSEVEDMLSPGTYNLKVTGELTEGTSFEGYSDEIRVIDPGK